MIRPILIACVALLPGCATILTGTTQNVTVSTAPAGATCTLDRMNVRVGAIATTPGTVRIDKSGKDLSVTCSKDGFQTATVSHNSSFNGVTFGNIVLGGLIGIIVDASSGANFDYPPDVRVGMAETPKPILAPEPVPFVKLSPTEMPESVVAIVPVSARSITRRAAIRPAVARNSAGSQDAGPQPY